MFSIGFHSPGPRRCLSDIVEKTQLSLQNGGDNTVTRHRLDGVWALKRETPTLVRGSALEEVRSEADGQPQYRGSGPVSASGKIQG